MKQKHKQFIRRNLPTLIALGIIFIFTIGWSAMWYAIGHHNAVLETTETLTAEFDARMQAYIDEMNYIPEDTLHQQEIDELADYLDELIAGYSMNSNINREGCYAIGWCFIARYMTGGFFGSTPQEILEKPMQWQWYNPDNPVRPQDHTIACNIATAYLNHTFPDDFTTDLCYAELKQDGTVVLRNSLFTDSNTTFWKYRMN